MSDFEDRLKRAIERGEKRNDMKRRAAAEAALSEEQCRELHGSLRLKLSDYIAQCLEKLPNYFPGFEYETLFGDKGWGGACVRDDIDLGSGKRRNLYSRLEMAIKPYSSVHVLELVAKGTVRNKELFNRSHFEKLSEVNEADFRDLIDLWIVEYAEQYSAK
ncbi:hypothetical protein DTL42_24970 [Bremerella cremea]|uniref:Uncharacterized protein n=1 Tax=Bremerella cremea TaxID=1031537 RepID=A0A368KJ75_9BACT|nr:hypothetical protein [Bremerella cremea]RCS40626.1 hypothetical protein DTL42_24970 [Bremerella cremea]